MHSPERISFAAWDPQGYFVIMKDLNLSGAINVVAWSTLSLSVLATGCKKKEEEPEPIEAYCEALKECSPDFREDYGSVRECTSDLEGYFEYFEDYSRACGKAAEAFLECTAKAFERTCDYDSAYNRCERQAETFYDECGDYDYDDYDYDYDY
jgi:hypothetical protein